MKKNVKGFTLAELMAVVIIIGIIAVVGLGSYSKSIARTRAQQGLALAHQVAAARDAYYYDHSELSGDSNRIPYTFGKLDTSFNYDSLESGGPTFEIALFPDFRVEMRDNYVTATSRDGASYTIRVYQEAWGSNRNTNPTCTSTTPDGQKICKDLGF